MQTRPARGRHPHPVQGCFLAVEKSGLFLSDSSADCEPLRKDVCGIALASVGHVLGNTASKGVHRERACQGAAAPLWMCAGIQARQWCLGTAITRREFYKKLCTTLNFSSHPQMKKYPGMVVK